MQHPRSTERPGYREHGPCTYWFQLKDASYLHADAGHADWRFEFGDWPGKAAHGEHFPLQLGGTHAFPDKPTFQHGAPGFCGTTTQAILHIRCATTEMGRLFFFDVHCDGRTETYDLWLPVRKKPHDARFRFTVDLVTVCTQPL
ncbi:MAG: hypothetical protein LC624_10815 [Halobacteriales archaeon]|nr:hypothetical protein [Halobacteriales archaeon]